MFYHYKIIFYIFSFFLLHNIFIFAKTVYPFEIEKGSVHYTIKGGGILTAETNLSVDGHAKLTFKSRGIQNVIEESGVISTQGSIKYNQEVKRFEKTTQDTYIVADYENEQLIEHPKSYTNIYEEHITDGYVKQNKEEVAGLECINWTKNGIQKCMYKGIVLKHTFKAYGISYTKVATKVYLDMNISEDECLLPDYPLHDFGLHNSGFKANTLNKPEDFCKTLKSESNIEISAVVDSIHLKDKNRISFINKISNTIFEKQITLLPELMTALQKTRACLHIGENPFEANQCIEHFTTMKDKLGTKENNFIILWDEQRKNELLDKIENELIYLQARMPCIKRAKNITDLSTCMR
ncbi:MAG: Unknown protein [uncultured Sulfurovum sp.]|uniref:Uncharacterized protein n=1 Tax=uncultured Sulfurovum sp. TaxID=269237 RepID=A0A6S6TR84_9BACT|nr:MAG: Unknown protein [uncultured Sulfurovum sp.]